jgi:FMN phosphatase YigB (HAD superfamily)
MMLVLFDVGGTLINDPFPEALKRIGETTKPADVGLDRSMQTAFGRLLDAWKKENSSYNFPLASHFLQEEIWIIRALRAVFEDTLDVGDVPIVAARLLTRYRTHVREVVAAQKQIPDICRCMEFLLKQDVAIGVASNDRDFATRSMLSWAGLSGYLQWVFTSEGISTPQQQIEKPQELFFQKIEEKIIADKGAITGKIYVGDHELNDVEIPGRLGYTTIRFFNRLNPADATWLDHRTKTQASYSYDDPAELATLLEEALRKLRSTSRIHG